MIDPTRAVALVAADLRARSDGERAAGAKRFERVSGLTLREGAKYLPKARRDELMRRKSGVAR